MQNAAETAELRILHLEDSPTDAELIRAVFEDQSVACQIHRVASRGDFENALKASPFDVVLSDYSLPGFDGLSALAVVNNLAPETPFIFVSGTIGEEGAVEALKRGATDYVSKDRPSRLVSAVRRAHREFEHRRRQKQIEEELHQRNILFQRITESVDDLIAVVDVEGSTVFTSPSYAAFLGHSKESNRFFRNVVVEDIPRLTGLFREMVDTGAPRRLGYRVSDLVGRIRHLESQWTAIRDKDDRVSGIVIVSRDVTEREKAAATIREQAELLHQARDAIFVRDLDQRVTYWNRGAERIYEWKAAEIIGKRASELLYKADAPPRDDIWKTVLAKGEWQGELAQIKKSGAEVFVTSRRTLLRDIKGEPVGVLNINTDITETKTLEAQLLRSHRVGAIGALAAGIAHDLNDVLSPIVAAAELLKDRANDEDTSRIIDVIRASARRGAELIGQVVQFVQTNDASPVIVDCAAMIRDLARFITTTFPPSIQVITKIDPGNLCIVGDATQLHQALLALCLRLRDSMQRGAIHIEARSIELNARVVRGHSHPISGRFVELSVRNTGPDVQNNVSARIYEQLSSDGNEPGSAHVDLPDAAKIIRNHNGFTDFSTSAAGPATIQLYFPVASRPTEAASTSAPTDVSLPMGHGEWILLVDDELALLEMTKELLESYGYHVLTAKDGLDALLQFGAHKAKIRAVITDLLMPGLGGEQLIDAIRDLGKKVSLICITGAADDQSAERVRADALLRKPCSTALLLNTLSRLLA